MADQDGIREDVGAGVPSGPDCVPCLDHGYVRLIETWGSDERIIESARMSTQKGFQGWGVGWKCSRCDWTSRADETWTRGESCPKCGETEIPAVEGDEKLLRFLWKNQHATPFEFGGAVIEVQAPIFVFREWHRHRTQSYNEASARYAPLPALDYVPTIERLMANANGANKQAGTVKGAKILDEVGAKAFQRLLRARYATAQEDYEAALESGVPKELARVLLPVGRYSKMRAQTNLRNWLAFITLRDAPNAQYEIQVFARAVRGILEEKFPRTLALFNEGRT